MVTDPDGCLHNNSIWLAVSEVPLRKGNTFLATGGRTTGEVNHHNHLPLAGDTIPAKGIEGKLAKTILEKVFLPSSKGWSERDSPFLHFIRELWQPSSTRRGDTIHTLKDGCSKKWQHLRSWNHLWAELANPGICLSSDFLLGEKVHFLSFKPF